MKCFNKFLLKMLSIGMLFLGGIINAEAANTVFDSPTISPNIKPQNMVYQSPNLNILADKWSYGLDGYIVNTSNLDDLIDELVANVSTSGGGRSNISIYPNGANLSDANISALRNAGWDELSLYCYDFFLIGGMPESGLSPNVFVATDAEIAEVLAESCNMDELAVVKVEGANLNPMNLGLYSGELAFLNSKFFAYKFIADIQMFVPAGESYIDSYASNVLEMYDLQNIEADVNGLYIVSNKELPAELITTVEEIPTLREQKQQGIVETPSVQVPISSEIKTEVVEVPTEETLVSTETLWEVREEVVHKDEPLLVPNQDNTVEWSFADRVTPEGFTPEAVIKQLNDKEVSVDFAYSGELPEGTQVTICIPEKATYFFNNGDTLYLYYNNPESGLKEYVGEGACKYIGDGTSGKMYAILDIYHCSEYIITYQYQGESYTKINMGVPIGFYIFVAVGVFLCSIVGILVYIRIKKQKRLVPADIWYDPTLKIDKFRG